MASGELVAVEPAVVEMAECDAQHLGQLEPLVVPTASERAANENAALPGQGARQPAGANDNDVDESTAGRCSSHVHVGAGAASDTHDDVSSTTAAAAPVATAAAVTSSPSASVAPAPPTPRMLPRARQTIPPALRRAVLERDRHRCQVPGCTHSTYVDVHHIRRRADGGLNVLGNLLTLCSAHHRATHRGELHIERDTSGALVFRHADGSPYGQPPSPGRIDAHTKVFSALRNLGFRELEVKAVLAELRADPGLADATVQQLLREALCRIQPRAT